MATQIQLRRGTAASWTSANPTLASGELGLETDTGFFKVGDGATAWASLDYSSGIPGEWDSAQTIAAKTASYTLLTADAGALVTFDAAGAVDCTVDGSLNLSAGQRIDIAQLGAGQVTVVASGATVYSTPTLKLRAQYSAASLICLSTDTYLLVGDLAVA